MKKIGIRVDGGGEIGLGHVIRCTTLAKEFRNHGCEVVFISAIEEGIKFIQSMEFRVLELSKPLDINRSIEYELPDILSILRQELVEVVVIDTYRITDAYFVHMHKEGFKCVYVDDCNEQRISADWIVNGNLYANELKYERTLDNQRWLLGAQYTLLRPEYAAILPKEINEVVTNILITTGGSDPKSYTIKILKRLELLNQFGNNVIINVVIGPGFNNENELQYFSQRYPNIIFHKNKKTLSDLMQNSDLAISAGGSTLYELCYLGVPTITFVMAENQRLLVESLSQKKCVCAVNFDLHTNENDFDAVYMQFLNGYKLRNEVSKRCRNLIDGKGPQRIVSEILGINNGC